MLDSYRDIFEVRGRLYDAAMQRCPTARDREFELAVEWSGVRAGELACDVPSGGGYLARYVPAGVRIVAVETAAVFARLCKGHGARDVVLGTFDALPLAAGRFDRVIGIAGLHHVERKEAFFREARRVLAPGGVLCVADAARGSAVTEFLDGFVDAHSSMGHRGAFFEPSTALELERCGFRVDACELVAYEWRFAGEAEMAGFVIELFGLDRADADAVIDGIARSVGYRADSAGCAMHWELLFIRGLAR